MILLMKIKLPKNAGADDFLRALEDVENLLDSEQEFDSLLRNLFNDFDLFGRVRELKPYLALKLLAYDGIVTDIAADCDSSVLEKHEQKLLEMSNFV